MKVDEPTICQRVCVYTAHSADTNRGPGPLRALKELSVSELLMVYSLAGGYSLIKSLHLLTGLVDPRDGDGSSWQHFPAGMFPGGISAGALHPYGSDCLLT